MTLSGMLELSEEAVVCDFAETYHIYDIRSLPLQTVATLAAGLRDDSRIKLLAAGLPVNQDTLLLAAIADRIEAFRLGFTKDPKRPAFILDTILGNKEKIKKGVKTFNRPEDLIAALKQKQKGAN